MAHVHLIIGPVGAGKSTFALQLSRQKRALWLDLDDWMAILFRPDRPQTGLIPWYNERVGRCIEQIWRVTQNALSNNIDVVLEIGLIQRNDRLAFYRRVDAAGVSLSVIVLDAPRDVRRARVERRNHEQGETFSMVVPPHIFEMASDLWEPPLKDEQNRRNVQFISSRFEE